MSNKRTIDQISVPSGFTGQVASFGQADFVQVQQMMAAIASGWTVELQWICSDEATLVLLPDGGDDAMGPSFMISRHTYGLRVDQVHWDALTEVGMFQSLDDVLDTLRLRVAFCSGLTAPSSMTIH